jgi:hypothetical protein
MWKGGVELSILVDKYLIAFRGLFLEINFQNESSFLVLLLIPTVAACSEQLIILLIQIEIESACRAEIGGLHGSTIYQNEFRFNFIYPSEPLILRDPPQP